MKSSMKTCQDGMPGKRGDGRQCQKGEMSREIGDKVKRKRSQENAISKYTGLVPASDRTKMDQRSDDAAAMS